MSREISPYKFRPGKPVPEPDDFPVVWENPEDSHLFWEFDGYHYPNPMAPLEFELTEAIYEDGLSKAAAKFSLPISVEARRINTYFYRTVVPDGTPPDNVLRLMNRVKSFAPGIIKAVEIKAVAGLSNKYMNQLRPVLEDLAGYWNGTLLPEVTGYLDQWESYDLDNATLPSLMTHLEQVIKEAERIGVIHFLIHAPNVLAMSQFDELFRDLFDHKDGGSTDAFGAYRLLQGFDNMILAGDRMLWRLGRKALTMPAVQKILEEKAAAEVIPALERDAVGQVFLDELNEFLKEHGHRGAMYSTVAEVSWLEDPIPVIKMLKDYITQPDRDMEAELAAEAAERQRLVNEARKQLNGYPKQVKDEFELWLSAAQTGLVLHSDHGYWIDYRAMFGVRRVLLAVGKRLVGEGMIDAPEDVFYLWLDEIREFTSEPGQVGKQSLIDERKNMIARYKNVKPPAKLGTYPLMALPESEPMLRAAYKAAGQPTNSNHGGISSVIHGHAGSPGKVSGTARIIRSLTEASKLQPGEILVAETTAPPWTPLFASAAAVVTDAGGILSHCAVVAREYHIPAVVGTGRATDSIPDGQLVEVNGDAGTVTIL